MTENNTCSKCGHWKHSGVCLNGSSDNDCSCSYREPVEQDTRDDAQKLLDSRRAVYGDRIDNMVRTAQVWSGLTGFDIQPWMVPLMMSAYKMLRGFLAPDYSDNIDDVDGWNKMFREVIGDDLVQARTVEEYLAEKERRVQAALDESNTDRLMSLEEFEAQKDVAAEPSVPRDIEAQREGEAMTQYERNQRDHQRRIHEANQQNAEYNSGRSTLPRHPYDRDFEEERDARQALGND